MHRLAVLAIAEAAFWIALAIMFALRSTVAAPR